MSRVISARTLPVSSFPRVSGDEPNKRHAAEVIDKFSPREWG